MSKVSYIGRVTNKLALAELAERVRELVYEYEGQLGVAEVVGILEIVKLEIIKDAD